MTAMSCEACEQMQLADDDQPHKWLTATGAASKLRPLGGQLVSLQRYRCSLCETTWLRELDPSQPRQESWICLYEAQNILDPASVSHPKTNPSATADKAHQDQRAVGFEVFTHRFS